MTPLTDKTTDDTGNADAGPRTRSWGDQGDGTYRNPILNADYPDVDIEQLGDTYYMIASSMHYAPGMALLESKDLVNWTLIGHVFEKLTWHPDYNWDKMKGAAFGVWAGDLAHHDGQWFCYFIDARHGLYVSSAPDIRGPWSEAHCMLERSHWTDPAAYWDEEEHQAYLVCNYGKDAEDADREGNQVRVFKMSWDGLSLEDEGRPVYYGQGAEAAKIYEFNSEYYLFLAEWINQDRKQLVLRGPSLYGPFERRIVMEAGNGVERSACQGALVQAPDGSWWYSHQLVQERTKLRDGGMGGSTRSSYEGRPQHLIPVRWEDGWPVLGVDANGTGIGNTVLHHAKPAQGFPIAAPQTDDDFDSPRLGPQWQWHHNPRDTHWSLTDRPDWLRLKAGVPVGDGGFWNAANTISQRLMGKGKGVAAAKVDLGGVQPGQRAGFCHHSCQYVLLGVRVDADGTRHLEMDHDGARTEGPAITQDVVYFRTLIDGDEARFEYGFDGTLWTSIGEPFALVFGRWKGDRLGFYCWNDEREAGHLDIDWFRYEYDGPRGI